MLSLISERTILITSAPEKRLAKLNVQWWNLLVSANLSEKQVRIVDGRGTAVLSGLNLPAPLKILEGTGFRCLEGVAPLWLSKLP